MPTGSLRFPRFIRFALTIALPSLVACSSTSSDDPGQDDQADCGAIEIIPAIVTVVSTTGAPIACDATITVLDAPEDAGAGPLTVVPCAPDFSGCPAAPTDGGAAPCVYSVTGNVGATGAKYNLQVSQPGFTSESVLGVTVGVGGCVAEVLGSKETVALVPESTDAG